jgi:hypothetical protein
MSHVIDGFATTFLFIMGSLFFLPPLGVIIYKLRFRLGCRKAEGRVLRIERNYDPDSESTLIQPVIHFTDASGAGVEVKTGSGYGLRYMPRVGERVKVYYRPGSQPVKFEIASRGLWEVSATLMGVGLVLMMPALILWFVR